MVKSKTILLLLLLCWNTQQILHAQDQINQKDSLDRKQGHWVYYGKDRPDSGIPFDGKVEEGDYIDDRKERTWIKYHRDGKTPKIIGTYLNNRPNGSYTKFHETGAIKEKACFTQNKYIDSLKRYFPSGQLEFEQWYDAEGTLQGWTKYYYESGQLEYAYYSVDKRIVGDSTMRFDEHGNKIAVEVIRSGCVWNNPKDLNIVYSETGINLSNDTVNPNTSLEQKNTPPPAPKGGSAPLGLKFNPNDYNKIFNADNELWQDGTFKDGMLWNGKVYVYDSDGILLKVKIYKEGLYVKDGFL